jgi:hypothetical protein
VADPGSRPARWQDDREYWVPLAALGLLLGYAIRDALRHPGPMSLAATGFALVGVAVFAPLRVLRPHHGMRLRAAATASVLFAVALLLLPAGP